MSAPSAVGANDAVRSASNVAVKDAAMGQRMGNIAGFDDVEVEFTHEVADGMHGAIVRARKTASPAARGLRVIQPASSSGCC